MERRNKEKVTFECYEMKPESNRIAFSLMSLGSESSWAFIPWTFAKRCWWQLGERLVPCIVLDERKRERHKGQISCQAAWGEAYLHLPRAKKTQGHHSCTLCSLRQRDTFQDITSAIFFTCLSYHTDLFTFFPPPFRETGGPCRKKDRYFLLSWAYVFQDDLSELASYASRAQGILEILWKILRQFQK